MIAWDQAFPLEDSAQPPEYLLRWREDAERFRQSLAEKDRLRLDVPYGNHPRCVMDLMRPESGATQGAMLFIHGGLWHSGDKSDLSHLTKAALSRHLMAAVPNYPYCPEMSVAEVAKQLALAIETVAKVASRGPIYIAAHGSGVQLATRLLCVDSPLPLVVQERIRRVLCISGLCDLRPLLSTELNRRVLQLDLVTARRESPVLLEPIPDTELLFWAGEDDQPEWIRHNELLANMWYGRDVKTTEVIFPGHTHDELVEKLTRLKSDTLDFLPMNLD